MSPDATGDRWVYERLVGSVPGLEPSWGVVAAVQFGLFETAVLALGLLYGLEQAILPGTVAVFVAAVGSAFMLDLSRRARRLAAPERYYHLLFRSSVEVVLGVLAFVALVTHLFVVDQSGAPLFESLLGERPPAPVTYLALLVLWDLCYRTGTSWWAAVVALHRSATGAFDDQTVRGFRLMDAETVGFAGVQLLLVPFLAAHPLLAGAVVGHTLAVALVAGASIALLRS